MKATTRSWSRARLVGALVAGSLLALPGCGGGSGDSGGASTPPPATYTIGGTVAGVAGTGVELELLRTGEIDGTGEMLTVAADGAFTFTRTVTSTDTWLVKAFLQPLGPAQWCVANNANGSQSTANVTGVRVTCTTDAFIGGTVTGLTGSGLTLALFFNPGASTSLPVSADGSFTFPIPVRVVDSWSVVVTAQPTTPAQTCIVAGASGSDSASDVTTLQVSCTTDTTAACPPASSTVTHASNITASEVWAGDGTVHLIPNPISIVAPATVTVQRCAIVKLANSASIDVRGDSTSHAIATLAAVGDDATHRIRFQNMAGDSTPSWGRLRAFNQYAFIDLEHVDISGGGNLGGSQLNAPLSINGGSTLPDALLKAVDVTISAPAGTGIYFSDAAFTSDSNGLLVTDQIDSVMAMPAMALGSVPVNTATVLAPPLGQIKVVENANIFDDLTITTNLPIHFNADGVHVGGLAPTFVPSVTLTLGPGVTLAFKGLTGPPMVVFGDQGQTTDNKAALVVQGTAGAPVTFTSGADSPAPGDWAGLWLVTSTGSQIDNAIIEFAGGDASIGPASCGPFDSSIHQQARHTAALLVGDGTDQQYVPPPGLITNSTFRNNTGNFAIDSVWEAAGFGPALNLSNSFDSSAKFCTQSKNLKVGGCFVGGVDQSGCLVP
jgi:hypothetical protein